MNRSTGKSRPVRPAAAAARRPGGFALVVTIVLIGLAALAAAAVTAEVTFEAARTRAALGEAQLRQLLLAGERAAAAGRTGAVDLPEPLRSDGASLMVAPVDGSSDANGEQTLRVDARLGARDASQVLRYRHAADGRLELIAARRELE